MIHVFLLLLYLGTDEKRKLVSADMYFRDINTCNYFAKEMSRRYTNYENLYFMDKRDRVTVYCLPKYVEEGSVRVYD